MGLISLPVLPVILTIPEVRWAVIIGRATMAALEAIVVTLDKRSTVLAAPARTSAPVGGNTTKANNNNKIVMMMSVEEIALRI
jgi:hypothetical protein